MWFIINPIRICNSKYTAFLCVQILCSLLVVIIETHSDYNTSCRRKIHVAFSLLLSMILKPKDVGFLMQVAFSLLLSVILKPKDVGFSMQVAFSLLFFMILKPKDVGFSMQVAFSLLLSMILKPKGLGFSMQVVFSYYSARGQTI